MIPFRVIFIILGLSSSITLSIMLTKLDYKGLNSIEVVSLALTLFAIVMFWSTSMLNNKIKVFLNRYYFCNHN